MLDHLTHDESQEFLGEFRVQAGGYGQGAQPGDLLGLAGEVRRGQAQAGFQAADLLGAFEALGEEMDQGGVYIVDAGAQGEEFFGGHGGSGEEGKARKAFFFEKKKQKTFALLSQTYLTGRGSAAGRLWAFLSNNVCLLTPCLSRA